MDDKDLFLAEMQGVTLLKHDQRLLSSSPTIKSAGIAHRRAAAVSELGEDSGFSTADIDILDPFYPLEFKRSGIQNGVYRKLKQGKYAAEAVLDLHNHTVEQARKAVILFLTDSVNAELRSVLIIHGRGQRQDSRGPVIKSYINLWLPTMDNVLAFCSAQPHHGGIGSVYVMLRLSLIHI